MNFSVNILSVIFIIGPAQGIFLAVLLFTKYHRSEANTYLAWLMLLYSIFILHVLLSENPAISYGYPYLMRIFDGLPFLFGPVHLMYVGKLTDTKSRFARPHWFHFVPFILYKIYYLQIFFLSREELVSIIKQIEQNNRPVHTIISGALVAVQGLIYAIAALFVFHEYLRKIKLTFSSIDKINLSWLRYFTILALFIWIIVFIENVLTILGIDVSAIYLLVPILTSIFVYATGYIGMFKTEIFMQYDILEKIHDVEGFESKLSKQEAYNIENEKYQKSGLTQEKADAYLQELKRLMEEEQLYTNPDITLKDLSERLNTSTHNISEVINTKLNQNFFDFINRYRIEKVKKDLIDKTKDHYTLYAIAVDAGFNSKSGFNAIFKRYTDQTPSEYRSTLQ